jgi:dCTP deaminase
MSILSDHEIYELALAEELINPFEPKQVNVRVEVDEHGCETLIPVLSYGLSSYGYDARVGNKFRVFTNVNSATVDPKNFDSEAFVEIEGDVCTIPPNSFALAHTVERFRVPRDVLVLCLGKSTYARCGIIVNVTPLEPEWEGQVTLEFSNTTPLPAKIYANEGACQFIFFKGNSKCLVSYADRKGKYQNQRGVTLPRM